MLFVEEAPAGAEGAKAAVAAIVVASGEDSKLHHVRYTYMYWCLLIDIFTSSLSHHGLLAHHSVHVIRTAELCVPT